MNTKKQSACGFTIIELLVVMVIIGILATITTVVYSGLQSKAHDVSVLSDLDRMDAIQTSYGLKHNTLGKAYYSIDGPDSDLNFTPSAGNVIRVVVNSTYYCIRGYNAGGTNNTINNALMKESTPGACALLAALNPPAAPTIAITLNGSAVLATVNPTTCTSGTVQYGIRSRINDGTWTSYTDWSSALTATQAGAEGVKYGYQAQAHCYYSDALISPSSESSEFTYNYLVNPPATPAIAVTLNVSNVLATITPVTCTAGAVRYGINSRTNDGAWGGYTAWSSNTTATQAAAEGVKYGYQAQAQCYISDASLSVSSTGAEGTYIQPITSTPATPTVGASTVGVTTTWSWNAASCPSGTSARYQYRYTISPTGYDSLWQANGTPSVAFTTSTTNQTYTVQVQSQCYNSNYPTGGPWSGTGSASYYRPIPTVIAGAWGGGAAGGNSGAGNGGGGGAYSQKTVSVPPGSYAVVVGGVSGSSYFKDTGTVLAVGGGLSAGGNSASGAGDIRYSGGNGGAHYNASDWGGGGGGGAAGPDGGGITGQSSPSNGRGGAGSNGDNNSGGAGGALGACRNCTGWGGAGNANGGGGGAGIWNNGAGGGGGTPGGGGGGGNTGSGAGTAGQVRIYYTTGSLSASGGSITTGGGNTYHTFTGSGTFTVN